MTLKHRLLLPDGNFEVIYYTLLILLLLFFFFIFLLIFHFSSHWVSLVAQLVKNPPTMWVPWVRSLGWEVPWRRERLPTPVFWLREFHGLYSPWGCKEFDTTEQLSLFTFRWHSGEEPSCQCRRHKRHRFSLWVRKSPWRRKRQPTLVFLPVKSYGQRSLAGYIPWGRKSQTRLSN